MPRIPYVDPEDLPEEKRSLLDTLSDSEVDDRDHDLEGGTLNVYRAIGNNLDVLDGFRDYGSTVWAESGLDPHEREVVILTTAYRSDSAYEWHQHVRVALDEGMDRDQIRAISTESPADLATEHAVLFEYVSQFVAGQVDDEVHERMTDHYDESTIVGVGALSGLYLGLARLLDALDVDTEVPFVGWELENL